MTMEAGVDKKLRRAVYERDGWRCALCDSTDGLQIHHYIPRGKGGANHPWNLITLCWRCHGAAHGAYYDQSYCTTKDKGKLAEEISQACCEYLADHYNETEGAWYPWEG